MPTLSASTTLSLPAGQAFVFEAGSGAGTAVADPNGRNAKYSIGPQQTAVGPFSTAVNVSVVIVSGTIGYRVDATGSDQADQMPEIAALSERLTGVVAANLEVGATAAANKAALQAAIDAAYAAGGGTVQMPAGTFNCDPGVEMRGGVNIIGFAPRLDFFQNCPDLLHTQNSGTRFVGPGAGSGALFIGRTTPNLTGPAGGPAPTWPDTTSDGLGMLTIGHFGVSNYDYGIMTGAKNTNGLAFSKIEAIHFEDMHEWCMKITNPQHVAIDRMYGYSVKRGIWMQGDNAYCAPGISYIERSFLYLDWVGAGEDYAQRYGIYVSCDSDYVDQASQMDGIRVHKVQINMYSSIAVADSVHIYAKGNADGARVVNQLQVRDTNCDGRATHAVVLENANNCVVEMSHHPATIDGPSSIRLISAPRTRITSQNPNTIIDGGTTSVPYYVDGEIKNYTSGSYMGFGTQRIVDGNKVVTMGSQYPNKNMIFDQANTAYGPFTFNPSNTGTPNTTWPTVCTLGTFTDQSGTSVAIAVDRAGVWKATNTSPATWTLPTTLLARGQEYVIVKKSGAGTVTIDAGAGRTIGYAGQTYAMGATVGASVHLVWDDRDNNWHIAGKN